MDSAVHLISPKHTQRIQTAVQFSKNAVMHSTVSLTVTQSLWKNSCLATFLECLICFSTSVTITATHTGHLYLHTNYLRYFISVHFQLNIFNCGCKSSVTILNMSATAKPSSSKHRSPSATTAQNSTSLSKRCIMRLSNL